MQYADDVDAAQLIERSTVGKPLLEFQPGAALRQSIAVRLAADHVKINVAAVDDLR